MGQHKIVNKSHNRKVLLLLVFLCLLILSGFLFIGINSSNIGFYLPRRFLKVVTILLVSYCIGYSSVSFQTITNNHILTPSVMGLDSLYLFIQTVVVFFFGSKQLVLMTGTNNFLLSVGIMIGAAGILFLLLFRGEGKNVYFLVLSGMVMGGLFNGLSTFMQILLDPNEFSILQGKMFASLNNINTNLANICIVIVIIVILLTLKDLPYLDVLSLGTDQAINLGVPYKKLVLKTLMISAVLISISTVLIGPITFLGILVVSLARQILNTYKHLELTIGATLIACLFLGGGLFLAERVFEFATPISVIINFFGGIYFIYHMLKESKK
ncbi:MAG: iron chelate uptake ABC transporter family permease subunit [Clostridiales bacterium]|nr:iron chelate uptake ABC transporter family permease subunit [Clostridiales bacterium]